MSNMSHNVRAPACVRKKKQILIIEKYRFFRRFKYLHLKYHSTHFYLKASKISENHINCSNIFAYFLKEWCSQEPGIKSKYSCLKDQHE